MSDIIRLKNVSVQYRQGDTLGPKVLDGLTLNVPKGSFTFITGPSGAGKSTLMKLLYMGMRATEGTVDLFGQNVHGLSRDQISDLKRRIGVVFQDYQLIPHLTALENVSLPLEITGADPKNIRAHVADLLNWVGLSGQLHAYPPTLSGGEQQRIAIARAVITKPGLLLADEPTGNLDEAISLRLLYLFEQLNKMGTTIMIATHNQHLTSRFPYPRLVIDNHHIRVEGGTL